MGQQRKCCLTHKSPSVQRRKPKPTPTPELSSSEQHASGTSSIDSKQSPSHSSKGDSYSPEGSEIIGKTVNQSPDTL